MIVYKIINNVNNKIYIGITSGSICKRWSRHLEKAKSGSMCAIHGAIRKYGEDAFSILEIARADNWDSLCELEKGFIAGCDCMVHNGYNMTMGGEGAYGCYPSEEARKKMSLAHQNRSPLSEEARLKISKAIKGRVLSEEHKKKISDSNKGRIIPDEQREKHSIAMSGENNPNYDKKFTDEHKLKISNALKGNKNCAGRICSDETKEKLRIINTGRKMTKEDCEAMSIAQMKNAQRIEIDGVWHSFKEWAEISGIPKGTLLTRYRNGKRGIELLSQKGRHKKNG